MYAAKRSVDCQIKKSGWQIVASPPASLTQTLAALLVPLLAVSRARPRGSPPPACTALRDRPALSWVAHLREGRQPQKSLKGDPLRSDCPTPVRHVALELAILGTQAPLAGRASPTTMPPVLPLLVVQRLRDDPQLATELLYRRPAAFVQPSLG